MTGPALAMQEILDCLDEIDVDAAGQATPTGKALQVDRFENATIRRILANTRRMPARLLFPSDVDVLRASCPHPLRTKRGQNADKTWPSALCCAPKPPFGVAFGAAFGEVTQKVTLAALRHRYRPAAEPHRRPFEAPSVGCLTRFGYEVEVEIPGAAGTDWGEAVLQSSTHLNHQSKRTQE